MHASIMITLFIFIARWTQYFCTSLSPFFPSHPYCSANIFCYFSVCSSIKDTHTVYRYFNVSLKITWSISYLIRVCDGPLTCVCLGWHSRLICKHAPLVNLDLGVHLQENLQIYTYHLPCIHRFLTNSTLEDNKMGMAPLFLHVLVSICYNK